MATGVEEDIHPTHHPVCEGQRGKSTYMPGCVVFRGRMETYYFASILLSTRGHSRGFKELEVEDAKKEAKEKANACLEQKGREHWEP